MPDPAEKSTPPMAEPGKRPSGADVGGIRANADAGLADAAQQRSERQDADASGLASTGGAASSATTPRVDAGGKNEPGSSGGAGGAAGRSAASRPVPSSAPAAPKQGGGFDDDEDEWRHPPVAPRDETNPLKSIGKAIGDVVTGSDSEPPAGSGKRST